MDANNGETLLPITGIILAGGKSSRMGRNKAFIEWAGVPLIEHTLAIFSTVFAEVMISSNHPELYAKYGVKVIKDNYLDHGPLGGLEACLREARYDYAFFAACDMPFLSVEVIRFMAGKIEGEVDILIPELDGEIQPLHAFYHKNCLPIIEDSLKAKHLKLAVFIRQNNRVRHMREKDFINFPNIRLCFSNMNTPQEYLTLQQHNLHNT
ncbi:MULTISPECIES: molybdenum cofactor guanylyltransferase [Desulfitobacterium]|uniref:Probable molybdenum cofactor guanylyltransferase n=1 Tax=Desulfitobacterium dehalogenans (strain ATCC 51507 / DSM 9161 / JW/IU-DC1) TaxID=756499 RepID=I4A711_DESDJ|nr:MULTISPECIES: molybdenum cofactor guanylyltransferase [Desulfitobacterium]AFL99745.1 molybdopterin-guanine dinucleotide biosynthesis protein A [Desulfitobacterium dehalogenans ATCC 51507]